MWILVFVYADQLCFLSPLPPYTHTHTHTHINTHTHTCTHVHAHTHTRSLSILCICSLLSNNYNRNWTWKNRTFWNTAHGHVILKQSLPSEKLKTSSNWPSLHPNPSNALTDISDTINTCVEQINSKLSSTLPLL